MKQSSQLEAFNIAVNKPDSFLDVFSNSAYYLINCSSYIVIKYSFSLRSKQYFSQHSIPNHHPKSQFHHGILYLYPPQVVHFSTLLRVLQAPQL